MHQGWPKFTESLWMATNDNGIVPVAYSPSTVKIKTGNGKEVTITEETNYPFDGLIKFRISGGKAVRFPLYLRIPSWAGNVSVTYKNRKLAPKAGSTVRLLETWKNNELVTMDIPMKIRIEKKIQ